MMGGRKNNYWYVTPEESRQFIKWLKFLFGINAYTELFTFEYTIANLFILGWLSSGTSYVLSMLINDDGIQIPRE